jgi:hypothetical protein
MSKLTLKELAAMPFIRKTTDERNSLGEMISGGVFDCGYAVSVWDARNRLALQEMIDAEPDKPHDSPDGLIHYLPHRQP